MDVRLLVGQRKNQRLKKKTGLGLKSTGVEVRSHGADSSP